MDFKVTVLGNTGDGSVYMRITTKSPERCEYIKRFCAKHHYQYKVEMIDD